MTLRFQTLWLATVAAAVLGLGAGCSQPKVAGDARASDAPDRIPALVRQADPRNARDADGQAGIDTLIHALNDDDPAVRLFAAQALRERTGQSFGYRYYDPADQRRAAIRRWRDWADRQDEGTPAPGTETNTASATPAH